ncbi:MAG TPA: SAM-dependent methyltransferase [Polyangiaceae bacterium]|nr:SAM-dependent methyltransferase [Polyangiaceae bacterium]
MNERIAATLSGAVQLALSPVTLAGYALWAGKSIAHGRHAPESGTAQGPLSLRYFQHELGARRDDAAKALMQVVPGVPSLGVRLVTGPARLAHRLTGHVPSLFRYPYRGTPSMLHEVAARTSFFDAALAPHFDAGDQLVVLGAGFDTRAYRLPSASPVQCFEVDTPETQAVKRTMLWRAHIDASRVRFVSADFERDDWLARLLDAGFDRARPAAFLWEGVTMYLERAAVLDTLRKIASVAAGSSVVFDYFTSEPLTSRSLYMRYARAATRYVGEPMKFGIDSTPPVERSVAELIEEAGLSLREHQTLGSEANGKRAFGGLAHAVVGERAAR